MHQYKLSRNTNERKALIRNLMRSLVLHGSIKTTKEKAKSASSQIERLITKAKMGTEAGKRAVIAGLVHKEVVKKFLDKATTQFASRNSGYTRIIKIGNRMGDATEEVILSFVDQEVVQETIKPATKKQEVKKQETKKEETNKKEAKKQEPKKEEKKKQETKKEEPKKKVAKATK